MGEKVFNISCPVIEVLPHEPKVKETKDWAQFHVGLTKKKSNDTAHGNKDHASYIIVEVILMCYSLVSGVALIIIRC